MKNNYTKIIHFWFNELSPKDWWVKNNQLDLLIKKRFSDIHKMAISGELYSWRESSLGSLAEIIVLDQFSRNIYRNTPMSFAYDSFALSLAQNMILNRKDQALNKQQKLFAYLPYMHSESKLIHEQAVEIFTKNGLDLDFEIKHKVIIDRFGRYPHRNKILNRESSAEEIEFLNGPNSSF